jgi:5'-3' exonuclease
LNKKKYKEFEMSLDRFCKKKKPCLVVEDMSNLIYRTVFTAYKHDPLDDEFNLWKYMMVERILNDLLYFKADRCIIAMDDRNYWRKDIYADYKNKRKGNRQKAAVDFDEFFKIANPFIDELQDVFGNMYFLKTSRCEADDIIAVLTEERWSDYNVMCISNDSDLKQLYKYKYYKQYDPIKMKVYNPINYKTDLTIKILTGDRTDDIPNVAPRVGPKKAMDMIDEGLDNCFKNGRCGIINGVKTHTPGNEIEENYIRNKNLIDLSMIPISYKREIKNTYDAYNINTYNGRKLFNFLVKYRLRGIIEDLEMYSEILNNLG